MNKLMVVTGGTKGIGRAIIDTFARYGFDIVTCARNAQDLQQLQKEIKQAFPGIQLITHPADLSKKSDNQGFADVVLGLRRPIDVLVNNAGYFVPGQVHNEPEGTLETMMDTNLYSAYYLTRYLIPKMIEARDGYVFNMCSIASIMAYPNGGAYSITKFALYGLTKVLREEMKPLGIRVTAVIPGATLTASWEVVDLPTERFMKAQDVAEAMYSAFALSKQSVVEEIIIRPQLGDL